MGTIAKRYAKALLLYAKECHAETVIYQQMVALQQLYVQIPELGKTMTNPVISKKDKKQLLHEAVGKDTHPALLKFLDLMVDNKREEQLLFVVHSFIDMYRKSNNIIRGKLTTAFPVAPQDEERFRLFIQRISESHVEFETEIDKDICGGFILQLDSWQMDASVAHQLNLIRKQFDERNR